jgi:hypothetical protein
MYVPLWLRGVLLALIISVAPCAMAQPGPSAPPAVGVATVERQPMTESYDFSMTESPRLALSAQIMGCPMLTLVTGMPSPTNAAAASRPIAVFPILRLTTNTNFSCSLNCSSRFSLVYGELSATCLQVPIHVILRARPKNRNEPIHLQLTPTAIPTAVSTKRSTAPARHPEGSGGVEKLVGIRLALSPVDDYI